MFELHSLDPLVLICALGTGLIAGVFFAFSTFVMKALGRLPAPQGIAAMQSINVVVINPWFMTAFFGTALASIVVAILGVQAGHPGSAWLISGSVLYVIGTIGVTMAFNVPRNNALAAVSPSTAEANALWRDYLSTWTMWNTVRTLAAFLASAVFIAALAMPA